MFKICDNQTIPILQLVNRQKSTKTKQPIPLSEDMLRELDKSHMGGFDDMHQLKERDLPYIPSGKVIFYLLFNYITHMLQLLAKCLYYKVIKL